MRTMKINLYKFKELSEDAKKRTIEHLYNINVDHEWWEFTYEDAKNIGLNLTGFDLDRANYCNGEFYLSANEVAQNILNEHGENCDTYKASEEFLNEFTPIFVEHLTEESKLYESGEAEEIMLSLESNFLNNLLNCYLQILKNEYEYLTSEEAIVETIIANDYEFLSEGGEIQ